MKEKDIEYISCTNICNSYDGNIGLELWNILAELRVRIV